MADSENDNSGESSSEQTFLKLLSLFYSYDPRLFIRMYTQGFLKMLITNFLSDLQIKIGGTNMVDKIWK